MKDFCVFIVISSGLYLAGELVLQNATILKVVRVIEKRYKNFNDFIKDSLVIDLLLKLKGISKIIALVTFLILLFFLKLNNNFIKYLSFIFLFSCYTWTSISWVTDHKNEISKLVNKELILFMLSPIILLFLDYIIGSNSLLMLDEVIRKQFTFFNLIELSSDIYSIKVALVYTFSMMLMVLMYYLLIWLITLPVFISIFLILKGIIYFFKMIDKCFPKKPFVGIVVLLFITSNVYLFYYS